MKKPFIVLAISLLLLTSCDFSWEKRLRGTNYSLININSASTHLCYRTTAGGPILYKGPTLSVLWDEHYIIATARDLYSNQTIFYVVEQLQTDTIDEYGTPWTTYSKVPWRIERCEDSVQLSEYLHKMHIDTTEMHRYKVKVY